MGRELERKFCCSGQMLVLLEARYGPMEEFTMETRYFDTPDRILGAKKWMLRLRRENSQTLCTLKTPLPDGSRGEWETESDSIPEALPRLVAQGAPEEIAGLGPWEQVAAARFTRKLKLITYEGGQAELALDRGSLSGPTQSRPLAEAELEYKSGSEKAYFSFCEVFAQVHGLTPEPKSKFQRARALE